MEGLNPAVRSPKREHRGALDPSDSPAGSGLEGIWGVGDNETIDWDYFTALDHGGDEMKIEGNVGFWEVESLSLKLNYQRVMDAWSDQRPLWAKDYSGGTHNACYAGEVPITEEERERRRARVVKYREKRQSRLFAKKIRYQVRKLNADKRPRFKGRFVKRLPDERFHEEKEPPHCCSLKMK